MESIPETEYGNTLEKVQRRATQIIQGYRYLICEERLIRFGLTTLDERRRRRGDLNETYKIITGMESMEWEKFFALTPSKVTRVHIYKYLRKGKEHYGRTCLLQPL